MEEIPLEGGNVAPVVRVGDTVRRATGPWTPAIHELLEHLEHVGFAYAPRALGIDAKNREILTYIDGETVGSSHPWPAWAWSEATMCEAAAIIRDYHDAVRDFRPQANVWRFVTADVAPGEIVCHNDIAPHNLVYCDGRIVGIIDWDLASPARPEVDLAWSAWTFAPLHKRTHSISLGAPVDVIHRIRRICDAYGLEERTDFVDVIAARMQSSIDTIERCAAAGDRPFQGLVDAGHLARMREDRRFLDDHWDEWTAAIGK